MDKEGRATFFCRSGTFVVVQDTERSQQTEGDAEKAKNNKQRRKNVKILLFNLKQNVSIPLLI